MSSEVPCSALNNAIKNKGISYDQLAQSVGTSTPHVQDILSGRVQATSQEFNNISRVLGVTTKAPSDVHGHSTK
ncbi:hypothetical protein BC827DRAFT_1183709 [Russula dissimulans]|nr:hypothetical protein BC827DRAFT_1183709 [Russula dissimulans]